ncbi:MAG: hypothetical protein PUQ00_00880 [Nostoc sp. S13]|nr:hypothetical protein [Nostoc sp. S13]
MPVARINLGILCDWWMNKRVEDHQIFLFCGQQESGGSESPTDCILTNVF